MVALWASVPPSSRTVTHRRSLAPPGDGPPDVRAALPDGDSLQAVNDVRSPTVGSVPSAAPSTTARLLALLAIVVAGVCGGLVGHSVTNLQCADECPTFAGSMGVLGAGLAAVGVGIVAVLALRAMSEWRTGQLQQAARDNHPVD